MVSTLIAIRHPAPQVPGLCAGRYELDVCDPASAIEAHLPTLRSASIGLIHTSPSKRCLELAQAASARLSLPVSTDARLLELDFGRWEGLKWTDIEVADGDRFANWCNNWQTVPPPGGESLPELEARVASFLAEVACEPALVITHAGPIRAILVLLRGVSWEQAMSIAVPYATPVYF